MYINSYVLLSWKQFCTLLVAGVGGRFKSRGKGNLLHSQWAVIFTAENAEQLHLSVLSGS